MSNMLCIPLNIIDNPFVEGVDPFEFPKIRHTKLDYNTVINDQTKKWFRLFNLEISLLEVFYSHPLFFGNIHIDRLGGDYVKLNWIFGGRGSTMQWYKLTENALPPYQNKTDIGTSSLHYKLKDCILIQSETITQPSLIQAGVPHTIKNKFENRWCVSFNFRDIDTKKSLTMDHALNLFNEHIMY